jgi:hypothetical protein
LAKPLAPVSPLWLFTSIDEPMPPTVLFRLEIIALKAQQRI